MARAPADAPAATAIGHPVSPRLPGAQTRLSERLAIAAPMALAASTSLG